jgi:hypothetical protein
MPNLSEIERYWNEHEINLAEIEILDCNMRHSYHAHTCILWLKLGFVQDITRNTLTLLNYQIQQVTREAIRSRIELRRLFWV